MFALGLAFLVFIGWRVALLIYPVRIVTGFEGSPATKVMKISNTHWVIYPKDKSWEKPHFFLFRVEGAGGRTVTFDIHNAPDKWGTLNPVYSYASSLDDPSAFSSEPVTSAEYRKAPNGSKLPDTRGQGWQFIGNAKWVNQTFSFSQKFDKDAYVCMSYPYTPGYNQRYLDSLTNNPAVQVITVGISGKLRPLQVVKIGEGGETGERYKPCVLIYAREYGDEQSSSWVAQGAIEFLASDTPEAREIRRQFTFLVIPVLDPDGAAMGVYDHIAGNFSRERETLESTAYGGFFKSWVDKGNPLQLVLNLHSLEALETQHLGPIMVELETERMKYVAMFLSQFLQPLTETDGFQVQFTTALIPDAGGYHRAQWRGMEKMAHDRLENWLRCYGVLGIPFELNTQLQIRHLTISDLRRIGQLLVLASARYLSSQEANPLMASVDAVRRYRAAWWQKYGTALGEYNVLWAEWKCKARADVDADIAKWEALQAQH